MTSGTRIGSTFWSWSLWRVTRWASGWRRGALPLDQALQVAVEIADALDKAHRQGMVDAMASRQGKGCPRPPDPQ